MHLLLISLKSAFLIMQVTAAIFQWRKASAHGKCYVQQDARDLIATNPNPNSILS